MTSVARRVRPVSGALLIGLVVGAGVILRVDGLSRKSAWIDEVMTLDSLSGPTLAEVLRDVESSMPPLYFVALWAWTKVVGQGLEAIRALPALLGVLCLPAVALIWGPLLGRRATAWALALLALNAYHIEYSQDGKMYMAVWFAALVSGGAFLRVTLGVCDRPAFWLAAFGLSTACLPMLSFTGVAPLGAQAVIGAVLVWRRPGRRPAVLVAAVVAALALAPSRLGCATAGDPSAGRAVIAWIPPVPVGRIPEELHRFFGCLLLGYRPWPEALTAGSPACSAWPSSPPRRSRPCCWPAP